MINPNQEKSILSLTAEEYEQLRALNQSPFWKFYRELLIKIKDAQFLSILPEDNPNKVLKGMGMVAGINLAINQLPMLVSQHDASIKRKQEKTVPL